MNEKFRKWNTYVMAHTNVADSPYVDVDIYKKTQYTPKNIPLFSNIKIDSADDYKKAIILGEHPESSCIAGLSRRLRDNENEMLSVIRLSPEAILRVGKSLRNDDFKLMAIQTNPLVYGIIDPEEQKNEKFIQAYADGLSANTRNIDVGADIEVPVYQHAIHPNCDLEKLYSTENYKRAHEAIIKDGPHRRVHYGDPRDFDTVTRFHSATAFLQNALNAAKYNPTLLEQYRLVEAQNIYEHLSELAKKVRKNPQSNEARAIAEAVAIVSHTMDRNGMEVFISPNQSIPLSQVMIQTIADAEKGYYIDRGQDLIAKLEHAYTFPDVKDDYLREIDRNMELAAAHPEMGISEEAQTTWWEKRGHDYELAIELERNGAPHENLSYFSSLAEKHPEVRIDEQLTIDGFDFGPEIK